MQVVKRALQKVANLFYTVPEEIASLLFCYISLDWVRLMTSCNQMASKDDVIRIK